MLEKEMFRGSLIHQSLMYIRIIIFLLLCLCSNAYGAYTGTMPKDIGTSTPAGTENPGIIDDVVRERGTVQYNLYKLKFVGTDTTLLANDTWVVGSSSSTSMLISFPSPSSCASTAVSKPFVITNVGTTTMVLNIVVDGVGSRTVNGSETVRLFTDGISWHEEVDFPNLSTQTIGKLNLGTQTAGTIGLGTQTSGTIGLGTQTSGTLSLGVQSGTISLGTQTSGLLSLGTQTIGTIAFGTQTSGLLSFGTQTLGLLSLGTQTNGQIDFTLQTGKIGLGTQTNGQLDFSGQTGKISLGTQTNNTISLGSQTSGLLSLGTQTNNTISFGTQTSGLLSLGTQTNGTLSLGTQTSGTISLTTQTTGNYLSGWTTGSQTTTATGTVRFNSTGDITTTSTYDGNGNGTITTGLAAGVSAKPDAKVDGVVQVTNPTAYAFPGTRVSITATNTTEALITFKNISLGTETVGSISLGTQTSGVIGLGTQTSGTLGLGSQTSGTVSLGTQTSGTLSLGTQTSGTLDILNPIRINFSGTTTAITGTQTSPVWYTLKEAKVSKAAGIYTDTDVLLYVPADAGGSSTTLTDMSSYEATITAEGAAVSSTAYSKFGGASLYVPSGTTRITSHSRYDLGTDTEWYISAWVKYNNSLASRTMCGRGTTTSSGSGWYFGFSSADGLAFYVMNLGVYDVSISQGGIAGWSADTEYHVAMRRFAGGGYQLLRDATVVASGTDTSFVINIGDLEIGNYWADSVLKGYIDDFYIEKNTNGTSTVPTAARTGPAATYYNAYSSYYIPANADTPFFTIIDDGTKSVKPQVIIGSTTSSATTTTGIKLEVVGGKVRADQFISPSEESKKVVYSERTVNYLDELKNVRIGEWSWKENDVNRLDAEATAKKDYIQSKREAWINANKSNYSTIVVVTGTGTVTQIDTIKMNTDYKTYIELDWASSPEQYKLVNEVENKLAAGENADIHIGAFAGDSTTPAIMQSKSKKELSLNDQIGWGVQVMKAQQREIGSLTVLVGSLTARLNAASIP